MDLVWIYFVLRYWRGIAWMFAWMMAFAAPEFIPIPVIGWLAPPLLYWSAVASRRRRLERQARHAGAAAATQRAWAAARAELRAGRF